MVKVQTVAGKVKGVERGSVEAFFGIPYAAPPVRHLRFQPPQPVTPWTGIRDATTPGATAPHRIKDFPGLDVIPLVGTGWVEGDDYLTLNIWRPSGERSKLPVMVWIHGGGFVIGSKDAPLQDGTTFARDGVICVAINYRLGIEGFLPIPGAPTNLGLRDMIAALEWVKANIAAFGGDPCNVTMFGESAGAMAIADLITSPLLRPQGKPLVKRAIVQSGHGGMTRSIEVAQRLVKKLAKILNISPDLAGFKSVDAKRGLDALDAVSKPTARINLRNPDGREPVFGISRFIPVHGDDVLPLPPLEALKAGIGSDIELLIGTNAEEMNLYLVPTGVRDKVGKWLSIYVMHRSQPNARKVLKAYGLGVNGNKPGHVLNDALNDLVFRWPARRFAEEYPGRAHMYELEWGSPAFDGQLGASHGMELPFVFDTLDLASGEEGLAGVNPPQELATRTHKLWVDFARSGTLPWPQFDRDSRLIYQLERGEAVSEPPMRAASFAL
uniref:Carboxylesterase type B n=2 Tax=environmental samples TaxID=48479 RepID=A0A0K0LBK0_9BACT|nr:carboxylesterase, type B [uncultured bacterium TB305_p]AIW81378.1 carboxylesterase type B [uncultured bacterium TB306_p]